jgi:hypothetical protein
MIDSALALGESFAELARRTGASPDALARHKKHLAKTPTDEQQLDTWLARINQLYHSASAGGDLRVQVEAIKSAMSILATKQQLADAAQDKKIMNMTLAEKVDFIIHWDDGLVLREYLDGCVEKYRDALAPDLESNQPDAEPLPQ